MKQGATIQLLSTKNKCKTVQREILGENNLARWSHHPMTTAQANPNLAFIKYREILSSPRPFRKNIKPTDNNLCKSLFPQVIGKTAPNER
jgi:hypothetical protein